VLAAIAAPVAVVALMTGGGGDDQPQVPAVINLPGATSVALPPTATPFPTPTTPAEKPSPTGPSDRHDCDEIRGTAYRSESEREWFLINCEVTSVANPLIDEPSEPAPPPAVPPSQPPQPTPDTGVSAGEAISLAVDWMAGNSGLQYSITEGSCSAVAFGSKWVVTCTATLQGCQGAACRSTLAACVLESGAVVSSESC
jgi:hypothetical protein